MGVLEDQIRKAKWRARGLDLQQRVEDARDKTPLDLASPEQQASRREFLEETRGDQDAQSTFERIILGNELQPINYLQHGVVAARPVCRLQLNDATGRHCGYASGFLIAPNVLLTNNHVFPTAASAQRSIAEFDVEKDVFDQDLPIVAFELQPGRLFETSAELDYAVVAVSDTSQPGDTPLLSYGFIPLIASTGKVIEGEWLTIIQHPGGGPKEICVRENQLVKLTDDTVWYSTDTLGGSSGSPVFNNEWQVVALHHKGIPEERNGTMQTVDGRDYDPARDSDASIKWIANEGIRISRIVADLKLRRPAEPLLGQVFDMTPADAKAWMDRFAAKLPWVPPESAPAPAPAASSPPPPRESAMRSVTVTLDIADDGAVSLRSGGPRATESTSPFLLERSRAAGRDLPAPEFDVPFDTDYSARNVHRKGYDPNYLGENFPVALPDYSALKPEATPLTGHRDQFELKYRGYTSVMHKERKFPIFTAANIDGEHRFALGRPRDVWRYDPRIPRSAQVGDFYYAHNQFDRGHLTRYRDMQYGSSPQDALERGADTLHFTNCTPQHARFNEGNQLWQGLEQHILEQSVMGNVFRAQVFTGPVLDDGDPEYRDLQYPLSFWKVAVAVTSENALFAAGFIMDQSEVIQQFGIEAAVEVPFPPFKTYQVPIEEIERQTGLRFISDEGRSLSEADPLGTGRPARRRLASRTRTRGATESTAQAEVPPIYVPLAHRGDIIRG